eukprot:scaffold178174_cov30-Tisochrysis_lutea.AAC.1
MQCWQLMFSLSWRIGKKALARPVAKAKALFAASRTCTRTHEYYPGAPGGRKKPASSRPNGNFRGGFKPPRELPVDKHTKDVVKKSSQDSGLTPTTVKLLLPFYRHRPYHLRAEGIYTGGALSVW